MPLVKIGCSGFMYDHWSGVFYPSDLKKSQWFKFYTEVFDTVEMNVTFYRLPPERSFINWYKLTPEGFAFSIKGSRFITHIKRLKEPEEPLSRFMSRAMLLKEKLSVVLWQFPPRMKRDVKRLVKFIELLKQYNARAAFEFRDETWIVPEVTKLLEDAGFCYCMADWPEFNRDLPITASYIYIRRHGHGGSYNTCYSEEELQEDAKKIKSLFKRGLDVYIYFNNDAFGYAPKNARRLKKIILGR
jgi:uncharacterized protein YecE (DUF72 family)